MRQSMSLRLDQDVINKAKMFAILENRTLTNYIETLIIKDVNSNKNKISSETSITVFIPEPITERLMTNARQDDTPEELTSRQNYLDSITGWDN